MPLPITLGQFLLFVLVLVRTSGLVVIAPIFGGTDVPAQVRVLLAVALAVLIAPTQIGRPLDVPQTLVDLTLLAVGELLLGLALGLGVTILLSGFQLAGQIIGQLSGMALAEVFNPSVDTSLPLISQLLHMFALAIFVTIGGHRLVMAGLLDTFATLPPGSGSVSGSLADTCVLLTTQAFDLGIRAAAPATVALLLATVIMGLISRTLPQLNVLSFGFGLSAVATFAALSVSLGPIAWLFQEQLEPFVEAVLAGLRGT